MMESLRKFALRLPGVEEGVACKGTVLESRTLTVGKKSFLFLRDSEARLKLGDSIQEAQGWSSKDPSRVTAGSQGWVLVKFDGLKVPLKVLEKWVEESCRLCAGSATANPKAGSPGRRGRRRKA